MLVQINLSNIFEFQNDDVRSYGHFQVKKMKRVFWKKNASRVKSSFQLNLLLNHIQTKKVEKLCMYPLLLVYKTDVKKGYLTVSLFGLQLCLLFYMFILKPAGLAHYSFSNLSRKTLIMPQIGQIEYFGVQRQQFHFFFLNLFIRFLQILWFFKKNSYFAQSSNFFCQKMQKCI